MVITPNGAYLDEQDWIAVLETRANEILPLIDKLFLACTDIGLSKAEYEEMAESFIKAARDVRDRHIQFAAERMMKKNFMDCDPYPKFPLGGKIKINGDVLGAPSFEASDAPTELPKDSKEEPTEHS